MPPFSILDNMPVDSPASAATSLAVSCSRWRRFLTFRPIETSRLSWPVVGAFEPVARRESGEGTDGPRFGALLPAAFPDLGRVRVVATSCLAM